MLSSPLSEELPELVGDGDEIGGGGKLCRADCAAASSAARFFLPFRSPRALARPFAILFKRLFAFEGDAAEAEPESDMPPTDSANEDESRADFGLPDERPALPLDCESSLEESLRMATWPLSSKPSSSMPSKAS